MVLGFRLSLLSLVSFWGVSSFGVADVVLPAQRATEGIRLVDGVFYPSYSLQGSFIIADGIYTLDTILENLLSMDPSDPNYPLYLEALNQAKARNELTQEEIDSLSSILAEKGAFLVRGKWIQANGPTAAEYMSWAETQIGDLAASWGYPGYGNSLDELKRMFDDYAKNNPGELNWDQYLDTYYAGDTMALLFDWFGYPPNEGSFALIEPTTPEQWDQFSANLASNELGFLWSMARSRGSGWISQAGQNLDWQAVPTVGKDLSGLNFVGSNFTADKIADAGSIQGSNLSGINLSAANFLSKNLSGCNLVNTSISGTQLLGVSDLLGADLSNNNLSGFSIAASSLNYYAANGGAYGGRFLTGVNLVGTGLTGADINAAVGLDNANLSGLNLAGYYYGFLNTGGVSLKSANLVGASNVGGLMNSTRSFQGANLSGLNLSGYVATMWAGNFVGANLSGATEIAPQVLIKSGTNINGVDLRGATFTGGVPVTKALLQQKYNEWWTQFGGTKPVIDWDTVLAD